MARIALNCTCGWNFFLPSTTPGHEVACPSCGQNVRIPGRKPGDAVPTSAGAIAAGIQQKQRTIKMLIGVGVLVLIVAGVLVFLSSGGPPPPPPPSASNEPRSTPRTPTPRPAAPDARPTAPQPPPETPLFTADQLESFRRDITTNIWLTNMSGVVSECARFRNFTNEWAQLQADMARFDTKIKHDLGELARAGQKFPVEPYLQAGDQFIGFVDKDLASLKASDAAAFIRRWLKDWTASPNQSQVNVQRGDSKLTIYIQFPEETKELLSLLRYPFLLSDPDPGLPGVPGSGAAETLGIPADLLKDIQGRFDALTPGYRNWMTPNDRKRLGDLTQNKKGLQEDIDWLRSRILGEVLPAFEQESIMIRAKIQTIEPKLAQGVPSDRLIFVDGRKPVECEVLLANDEIVKVKIRNNGVTYKKEEILRIEKGKGAATEFPARYSEAKGSPDKLGPLLTIDAANDGARAAVGMDRAVGATTPGLSPKISEDFPERKIDAIAGEVTTQYKVFADVVNEMRRRTESLTTRNSPLAPAKSIKGTSVIGNPLTFKPAELTVPQSIEIGTWWGGLNPDDRRDFARYYGLWCAYTRGMSKK